MHAGHTVPGGPITLRPTGSLSFLTTTSIVSAIYFLIGVSFAATGPGLQGDEAYLLEGIVRLLRGDQVLQLMATPYHGSLKTYILLPVFAITGVSVFWARVVSLAMGFGAIAGVGVFMDRRFGRRSAVAAMAILAIHPGYVSAMVFDSTGLPLLMLALGGVLIALNNLLTRGDRFSAFMLGTTIGVAGWARANFVWPAAALAITLVLFREPALRSWRRLTMPVIAGGLTGAFPLVLYQLLSHGGTFSYMSLAGSHGTPHVADRFRVMLDVVFYDSHRRYIWGSGQRPEFETLFCAVLVLIALSSALLDPRGDEGDCGHWTRFAALWLLLAISLTFTSRMPLGPHHFLAYLPIAVIAVAGWAAQFSRGRLARSGLVIGVAAIYAAGAISWDVRTVRGLRATGGVDLWSNSIDIVEREVERRARQRAPRIVSWGPNFSLYVLSHGRIEPVPLFWKRSATSGDSGKTWESEVRDGGLFVLLSDNVRDVPTTARAFRNALHCSGKQFETVVVRQHNGEGFAEIYDVPPTLEGPGRTTSGDKLE
ncbi:MAG: hypothetical protein ABI718_10080 [Acidobacteriota bacterium]